MSSKVWVAETRLVVEVAYAMNKYGANEHILLVFGIELSSIFFDVPTFTADLQTWDNKLDSSNQSWNDRLQSWNGMLTDRFGSNWRYFASLGLKDCESKLKDFLSSQAFEVVFAGDSRSGKTCHMRNLCSMKYDIKRHLRTRILESQMV